MIRAARVQRNHLGLPDPARHDQPFANARGDNIMHPGPAGQGQFQTMGQGGIGTDYGLFVQGAGDINQLLLFIHGHHRGQFVIGIDRMHPIQIRL